MTEPKPQPARGQPPRWKVPKDLNVIYANLVRIGHTPGEMIFDFTHLFPGDTPVATSQARIVMTPLSAKLLYQALGHNLKIYEQNFGEVNVPLKRSLADFLFKPPQPPEGTEPPEVSPDPADE